MLLRNDVLKKRKWKLRFDVLKNQNAFWMTLFQKTKSVFCRCSANIYVTVLKNIKRCFKKRKRILHNDVLKKRYDFSIYVHEKLSCCFEKHIDRLCFEKSGVDICRTMFRKTYSIYVEWCFEKPAVNVSKNLFDARRMMFRKSCCRCFKKLTWWWALCFEKALYARIRACVTRVQADDSHEVRRL